MDYVVLLILPPHIRAVEGGSDHIWILLPSPDAHFRSQNKGVRGVLHLCVREGHMSVIQAHNNYYHSSSQVKSHL